MRTYTIYYTVTFRDGETSTGRLPFEAPEDANEVFLLANIQNHLQDNLPELATRPLMGLEWGIDLAESPAEITEHYHREEGEPLPEIMDYYKVEA